MKQVQQHFIWNSLSVKYIVLLDLRHWTVAVVKANTYADSAKMHSIP